MNKIYRKLRRAWRKSYTYLKLKNVGKCGRNVTVIPEMQLMNPQYICIGDDCYFGPGCRIEAWDAYNDKHFSPKIEFGNDVRINSDCHIGCIRHIRIGDQTLLGSHVMIIDHSHGCMSKEEAAVHPSLRDLFSKGEVVIGKRCWIGENACILPGVHIGDGCVIGANAVVTKDMPAYSVIAGNPAKVVKTIQ